LKKINNYATEVALQLIIFIIKFCSYFNLLICNYFASSMSENAETPDLHLKMFFLTKKKSNKLKMANILLFLAKKLLKYSC